MPEEVTLGRVNCCCRAVPDTLFLHAGGSRGGPDDLLSVLLHQRGAEVLSEPEDEQPFRDSARNEEAEDSDEEGPPEDSPTRKAEDADVQAQLRNANEASQTMTCSVD